MNRTLIVIALVSIFNSACVNNEEITVSPMTTEDIGGEPITRSESLPEPIDGCNGVLVTDQETPSAVLDRQECVTCEGARPPSFVLEDLNPTSCGYRRHYGLNVFEGKVTFVVLLRSHCSYCQRQLEYIEQMRFELLATGHELQVVIINERGAETTIEGLTERTQAPIFQDLESVLAWESFGDEDTESETGLRGGDKDDMYIYSSNGTLVRFLDDDDPSHSLNLMTEEGYAYLKAALLEVFNGE